MGQRVGRDSVTNTLTHTGVSRLFTFRDYYYKILSVVPHVMQSVLAVYFIHSKLRGQRSLAGGGPQGRNKSGVTEQLSMLSFDNHKFALCFCGSISILSVSLFVSLFSFRFHT